MTLVKPAVLTILLLVIPIAARAQTAAEVPAIVTQGDVTLRRAPDLAWVQIAVEARGATPESARERAASAMTSVMSALRKSLPSNAIRTSGFSIQPEMEYPDNKPRVRDYVARNQVEARVDDLDKLASVMDASVANGATSIAGLRFDLEKRDEVEREALRLAVEDGMARAEAIAKGAHRELGSILRITEQRMSGGPRMYAMPAPMMAERAQTPTPISPAEIEIQAQVMLTVAIK